VQNLATPPMVLSAGETNELRMEIYDARDRAMARLFWSSATSPRMIIPTERLIPATSVDLPSTIAAKSKYPAGVLLANGSMIPGQIESADRTSVWLAGFASPLSIIQVARLILRPITEQEDAALQRSRSGVLLKTGDFVEGTFAGFKGGEIEVGSVVLGSKKLGAPQVTAVILRQPAAGPAQFEIKTRNQGLYRVNTMQLENQALLLTDSAVPRVKLAMAEIVALQRIR